MNLENYFVWFEGVIPSRICDLIIKDAEEKTSQTALIGGFGDKNPEELDQKDISKLYKTRNSSIVWLDDPCIYREVMPFVHEANTFGGWNFNIEHPESCQFTKYRETQHYTWHQDSFPKPINKPNTPHHGLTRKLSVTVSLADGDSYEGGDLEFDLRNNSDSTNNIQTVKAARKKGSIVVFPSFVWHRVTPVTQGTRYSLVVWNLGAPFK